ncbi:aminoglycoside phosphotransferase [Bifidobacterium pullorum subsp. saeculare]|uniref:Aminoglycoside phosphotransferase n=1 Tax=Bifidobacterium pullorum subsp. saeculare TaxID=78257 RepID=A0A938WVU5_9BIFI|nr:phosphotransferase [Bifidobacterium pullorum]MBM6699174.1 aminoglycoside phosphotransferase [Bifidobacterium pullorum subsp. saeculare]
MPNVPVAGVRAVAPAGGTDARLGIDRAVVQDAAGRMYDVYAADDEAACKRLQARVQAARTLAEAREPNGLGFAMDRVVAFVPGGTEDSRKGPTGGTAVMVLQHQEGEARDLALLTHDDCMAIGTAIGAVHRLNPAFLAQAKYPVYTNGQIRAQLLAWIANLRQAGHVPQEITTSWSRIVDTEGLWSFATCMVHGGFEDGDVRFSGSTVTAIGNWQDMQVNDPARDLGWIFSKLDEDHRNAVLTAYGRMMGNRLDDLIMLRANLWVQMEQVGDFIRALSRADSAAIARFRAQVDQLAHRLAAVAPAARPAAAPKAGAAGDTSDATNPSTITVGTLLKEGERRQAARAAEERARATVQTARPAATVDRTADGDRTGSSSVTAVAAADSAVTIAIADLPDDTHDTGEAMAADATADATPTATPATPRTGRDAHDPVTIAIPLLEREERALRDARAGLDGTADDTHDTGEAAVSATPTA